MELKDNAKKLNDTELENISGGKTTNTTCKVHSWTLVDRTFGADMSMVYLYKCSKCSATKESKEQL